MTQDEIIKAVAQVAALPTKKRNLMIDTNKVKYGVMMTYPYFSIIREESGDDLYFTFNANEANQYRYVLQQTNPLCEYETLTLSKHYEF